MTCCLSKKLKQWVKKLKGRIKTFGALMFFISLLLERDTNNHKMEVFPSKQILRFQLRCEISQNSFCVLTWKHWVRQNLENAAIRWSRAGSLTPGLQTERWMSRCFILKDAAARWWPNTLRNRYLEFSEDKKVWQPTVICGKNWWNQVLHVCFHIRSHRKTWIMNKLRKSALFTENFHEKQISTRNSY